MNCPDGTRHFQSLSIVWVALCAAVPATAQIVEDTPVALEGVGITEKLDEPLPLDLTFRDESGKVVALGEFFREGKPVVLNLVYFSCPMLCNVLLDGFTATLREIDWTPGREFEIVTVSIDPNDTPEGAVAKREFYLEKLGRPDAGDGWHFLTGEEKNIRRLARTVGFQYRYDEKKKQYMHSAGIFLSTPAGKLSRYLYGVMFDPQTLRLSLVEASDGKIGSTMDQILLFCFAYDHTAGRYGPAAMKIMRIFATLLIIVLGGFLLTHWRRESHRTASAGARP